MRALGLACIVALSMGAPGAAQRRVELPATDRRITSTAETVFSVGREEDAAWSEVRVVTHVPRMPAAIRGNASGSGAAVRPVARAFYPQPYRALLHTEAVAVISGTNPGYRVDLLNSDGRPQLTLVRASTPRRVTEQDRNDARNAAFDPACGLRERDRESAGRDPSPSLMLRDVTWARFPRKQLPDAFSTGGRAAYSVMNEDGVETIVERLPTELR